MQPLNSYSPAIGEFLTFNCTAIGNPQPKVTFYKNGAPLEFDYIVTYNEPIVKINTYEEEHKGIYQCVANNSAGETHSTALYSWMIKRIPKRPEKVKCYPLNHSSILIDYQTTNDVSGMGTGQWGTSENFFEIFNFPVARHFVLHQPKLFVVHQMEIVCRIQFEEIAWQMDRSDTERGFVRSVYVLCARIGENRSRTTRWRQSKTTVRHVSFIEGNQMRTARMWVCQIKRELNES